ncbi:Calx-beta domain-containing protein [Halarcobacter anaerophilus]|uniref:Calx-beta domain-containing protein n=1 Tax=Halarcobacter anaerophilus TaxID=877500 RepID=A0A4Q0XWC4_9BACT|nr:Calx-beta domain-containing protein [Halarcobacter anaerophilus]QDF28723.1 Calx-beta domain-containing protein [Halarcobacter anaerophilus]RXJ61910.1 hypothetical protein CRV06_12070 [Halarcobacter anaerophilus]
MAAIAGSVKSLSNGIFHVKDENGNIKVLQVGDTIYEKDTIYGDDSNTASSNIEIELSGNDVIVLSEGQKQLIDSSLIEKAFGTEELYFTREGLNLNPDEYRAQEDVVSDLRDAKFKDENSKAIDENAKDDNQDSNKDVTKQETAEGEEEVEDETVAEAQFQARDGDQTNVESDLRDATFRARTQNYIDRDLFKSESDDRLSFDNGSSLDSFNSTTPVTPTTPPRASSSTRPEAPENEDTPETNIDSSTPPPTIIAQLSINDTTAYESEGYLVFTVTLDTEVNTDVTFSYVTSQLTATSGLDYTDQSGTITIPQGSTSVTIRVPITDDYLSDSGETMKITVSNVVGNAEITKPVGIGTILDNSDSSNPANEPNGYEDTDTVYAIIEGPASVNEGDTTTEYTVKLVDKDGNLVIVTEDTEVVVKYTNTTTQDGDTQYNNNEEITVTITAGNSSSSFTVDTISDANKEDDEIYNLEITDVENTGEFENVKIGDTEGNHKDVDTTIYDTTSSNPETGDETVKIVLVAVTSATTTIADITNSDGTLKIDNTNSTPESGKLYYMAVAVDSEGKPLTTQDGTVDITYGITSDTLDKDATSGTDYDNTTVTNVNIGEVFEVLTNDDYLAEGDENFTVTISNQSGTSYESPSIDTSNDTVTSTITDNPANDTTKDPQETPSEPSDPDNPTSGNSYGDEDTLYVKITQNDSVYEGNTLTHTVTLVDKDGNPVTVAAGETITITLSYSNDTSENADYSGSTKVTQVTITEGNSTVDVENLAIDDFVVEGNENYTLTITDVSQSNDTYENVAIDTDNNSVTGEIKDGVSLGVPNNAAVDEDDFDITVVNNKITDTQLLNVVSPNEDNSYKLLFVDNVVSKDPDTNTSITLTSNGQNITFNYSTEGKIIATRTGDNKVVFEITLNKNTAGGSNDSYTYTQYENIDHPDTNSDDNVVLTFEYKIEDQGETSDSQSFTVTVNDSMPSSDSQNVTLNEDNSKLIVISDESFLNGEISISNDGGSNYETLNTTTNQTIDIFDNLTDKVKVGTLTNNGDGTLTFTPEPNYSGATAGFSYGVSDNDGDSASSSVTITVNPIADKPDMNGANTGLNESTILTTPQVLEDNNNASAEESTTDYTAEIGLILPQISDNSDYTTDAANDDQPEKLGLITLSSSTGSTIIANGVEYDLSAGSIQIYITNDPDNYHYSGIDTTGVVQLTQAQFEAIFVVFEKDDATNPLFTVSVDEYEVNDDDTIDTSVTKATNSQDYEVDILAVTDPVTLEWNSNTDSSSNDLGSYTSDTFTFDAVDEGYGTIDLKSLLTNTNGLETDSDGDLDGSEKRSYIITGIPEGTIVTLGGKSVAADSTGTVTIDFPDNTEDDPAFTMTIAEQFSGTISGTITLNVTDTDDDSTGTISTESATVSFTMTVNPVADQVTLKVAQAQGLEDAGRTNSNDENVDADVIDAPEDGIELYINVISDDNKDIEGAETTDEKEEYNVTISGIPDGGSLYVYDNSSSNWKLVTVSSDGTTVTIDGVTATSSGDITVDASADGTYSVTINDYQNDNLPKFIPPYNSDENYTFDISAVSFDAPDTSIAQTLQIDVTVDAVADIPVNDNLATTTATDDNSQSNSFNLVSTEDTTINLKNIFSTPAILDSNDLSTEDDSETLTFKVTGLAEGFSISGATFIGGTGTDRIWLVDKTALNNNEVTLSTPTNYAGEVDFKVQFVTTEDAGDSKTHDVKDVSIMITPVAEGIIASSDTQNEDEEKVLNFGFSTPDTDGETAGIESLESFSIDMSTVPAGVTLVGSVSGTLSGSGYVSLNITNGVPETVTAILSEDSDIDYSFNISYSYKDVAIDNEGNTYTDTKTVTNQLYSVTVNAITDDINLDLSTTIGTNNSVDGSGNITVSGNGTFTKTLLVTGIDSDGRGNADIDGSEEFTRVTVSGVPEGITVVGGIYAGDTGGGNYSGYWYVDVPNEALDNDGATYDLVFNVDGSFSAEQINVPYNITVTAYNQEKNNDVEQSDSQSFTLTIDQLITGPGPGVPATITAFYQDIDQDNLFGASNIDSSDHGYEVSTTTNTTITDSDAYEGSVVREDTQFKLSDVIHVETDVGTATSQAFSITLKNIPEGVEVDGMTLNAEGFYTISGSGDQLAIVGILQSILITPVVNANTDANDISNTTLNFDIELTTYANGGASNSALINFSASVLPVTDEMTLTVVNDGQTNEDVAQSLSITLDNDADGVNTQIIDGKVYLKLTESYSDSQGTDGTSGTLSYNGSIITATAVSGVTGLTNGDYYVIENVEYNDTLDLTYTPASNRDGNITVDVYVNNKESENWTSYDTDIITTHKTISFTVDEVADGFTLNSGATISGTEDELVMLDITLTSADSSESLSSVSVSGLPDGFLIYYGELNNGSDKVLANNLGVSGTTTIQLTYGVDETVDVNRWNIPLNAGQLPSYIWVQTPENWSGVIPDLSIIAVDENGNIYPETIASGTISPVVDSLTLNATQTFGKEGEDTLLNLNANVEDLDGSETVTLTLHGFGDGDANFKASGEAISSNYDLGTDTYTIEGISVDDINALTVTYQSLSSTSISVTAKMIESDGNESSIVNDSFNISIAQSVPSGGDDTLLLKDGISFDGLDGIDTLVLNGKTLDASLVSNIEILDLDAGDNSLALSLDDVLDMTDSNNEIKIVGDSNDSFSLDKSGWTQGSVVDNGDNTTYQYSDGTNTVKLTVDENINTSGL